MGSWNSSEKILQQKILQQITALRREMATKADIADLRCETKADIADLRDGMLDALAQGTMKFAVARVLTVEILDHEKMSYGHGTLVRIGDKDLILTV